MLTINFRQSLIDLALSEEQNNKIAKVIALYYPKLRTNERTALFEDLLFYYQKFESEIFKINEIDIKENSTDLDNYVGKDFRIKNVIISNLKGIPSKEESNNLSFGLNLFKNESFLNAIILANNGTGKSSVFAGLEMIYAREIGEKRLRSFNSDNLELNDYKNFLKRFPNDNEPICKISTENGEYDLNNPIFDKNTISIFNPKSHFITEFDIIDNGKNYYDSSAQDKSFHNILAKNLGLEEYLNFHSVLEQIPSYSRRKESTELNKLKNELKDNNKVVGERQNKIIDNTKLISDIENGDNDNKNPFLEDERNELEILNKLMKVSPAFSIENDTFISEIKKFKDIYEVNLIKENMDKANLLNFLEIGKNLLLNIDDCPYCLNSKIPKTEIDSINNQRITDLLFHEQTERDLRESFRNVSTSMLSNFLNIQNVFYLVEKERSDYSKFLSLDSLIEKANSLFVFFAPYINDEEMWNIIQKFSTIQFPNENDYNDLFVFLAENKDIIEKVFFEYSSEVHNFIVARKLLIEKEIQKVGNTPTSIFQRKQFAEKENIELANSIKIIEERNTIIKNEIIILEKTVKSIEDLKLEIKNYNIRFSEVRDNIIELSFLPIKEIIEEIIGEFIDEENIKLSIFIEEEIKNIDDKEFINKTIVAKIIDKVSGKTTTPDIYFNTFRYKLFCLMISLSISLATRKKYKINLPLVMDDLFYASDFMTKHYFSEFMTNLIKQFKKHTPELPLQFIIFTHDDVIFRSGMEAIDTLPINEKFYEQISENTLYSRIYGIKEIVSDSDCFEEYNGESFWNLLYTIQPIKSH